MERSLGIVVPAYEPDVDQLLRYLEALEAELAPETVRIELDAPAESTTAVLADTSATVNTVQGRRGKGAAITDGFEALSTDVLAFADADGSTPATSIGDVVAPVVEGQAAMAVGSRRHPNATVRSHQTVLRHHLGDVFAWLARRFLSVELRDYQCGAKALERAVWESIREHLTETGFAWDVEVIELAGALGHSIVEVPVIWEDHPDSTVSTTQAVPDLLQALFSVRRRSRRLRSQVPPEVDGHPVDRLAERDR